MKGCLFASPVQSLVRLRHVSKRTLESLIILCWIKGKSKVSITSDWRHFISITLETEITPNDFISLTFNHSRNSAALQFAAFSAHVQAITIIR